jgi:oxygen-independent coproporphyrinogen-3 oxidase
MGLRLADGVDPARVEARSGLAFAQAVDPAMLAALIDEQLLRWTEAGRLAATPDGLLRLDALLPVLLR